MDWNGVITGIIATAVVVIMILLLLDRIEKIGKTTPPWDTGDKEEKHPEDDLPYRLDPAVPTGKKGRDYIHEVYLDGERF
jgi:hypothetical protein